MLPRFKRDRSGFDAGYAAFYLSRPCGLSIGIRWAIKAREQFCGHFRTRIEIEAQGVGENGVSSLRHISDLTPGFVSQQAGEPGTTVAILRALR